MRSGRGRGKKDDMELRQQVRDFVVSNFYVPDPTSLMDDASLLDLGIIDSTGVLEMITFIEETFGFAVEDHEMLPDNLDSIELICAFVARKQRRVA
jgi:acyl carrier protein